MAELIPIPLPLLLRRAFAEYEREAKIFDLPNAKIFRGLEDVDLSVDFNGKRVFTPLGPAAGPQGQLAQNIVLSFLGGARIIELKTVQILDELKIPRPCIDVAAVGYNVEWSQELKLEQSLEEYVKASMMLDIMRASRLLGDGLPAGWGDTAFDMSVGYNLDGIRSPRMREWLASMKDATAVVDRLRAGLTGRFAAYRDYPFQTRIASSVALSTFHGCPAGEIEGIVTFLLVEMGLDVCIKMNPTLLGFDEVERLLHGVLGYTNIPLTRDAFEKDMRFDEALDLVRRLNDVANAHGRKLSVKFSNTLVVKNHRKAFTGEVMYMSGAPLHVITLNLVKKYRERVGALTPISFSAGMDANNVANMVALNFVPVTTCTDLLRPGGYGRLIKYLENLGAKMREVGAANIGEFILRRCGNQSAADVDTAGLLNTPRLVDEATADPRYRYERNKTEPRKIGSHLALFDCIDCDKCVPVCPNDANFSYEIEAGASGLNKQRQFANYADACNECGNCDVFCPEDGGPFVEKPRFFGSMESYQKYAGRNGFYLAFEGSKRTLHGTIAGRCYTLSEDTKTGWERFDDGREIPTAGASPAYQQMKMLLGAVADTRHVNFANAAGIEETTDGKENGII